MAGTARDEAHLSLLVKFRECPNRIVMSDAVSRVAQAGEQGGHAQAEGLRIVGYSCQIRRMGKDAGKDSRLQTLGVGAMMEIAYEDFPKAEGQGRDDIIRGDLIAPSFFTLYFFHHAADVTAGLLVEAVMGQRVRGIAIQDHPVIAGLLTIVL